jgi:HEAT repeat protein
VPLLRETLVKSFQNETNLKIRKEIIYALNNLSDRQATDHLKKLYAVETDREIKKVVISSFGASANRLHGFDSNAALKNTIEMDFLLEIINAEKDAELRRLAFSNLQRFQNWAANEQTIDVLSRLYDSETDEAFKASIIRAFSSAKQTAATRKLLDIAKNDKSDKLRLEAIYALRTSKNPEVLKFLEDLIK